MGLEYMLLHIQEPILYVIRKQHRHSATVVTPLADFYIIAGVHSVSSTRSWLCDQLANCKLNIEGVIFL